MMCKLSRGRVVITMTLLLSGCVKHHTEWNHVQLLQPQPFPFAYASFALMSGTQNRQTPSQRPSVQFSTSSIRSQEGSSDRDYSRVTEAGGSSYRNGNRLTKYQKRWIAVGLLLVFIATPFAWLLYPSWRRSRKSPRSESIAPAPEQTSTHEIQDDHDLCPNCGSRMVQRVAKRGRHAGKPFYGCSTYPRCSGIRTIEALGVDPSVSQPQPRI